MVGGGIFGRVRPTPGGRLGAKLLPLRPRNKLVRKRGENGQPSGDIRYSGISNSMPGLSGRPSRSRSLFAA